jgi:hypothetical protein
MNEAFAACNRHMPGMLKELVKAGEGKNFRVINKDGLDSAFNCKKDCSKPAVWYFRRIGEINVAQ